jgi:hypothetical protein
VSQNIDALLSDHIDPVVVMIRNFPGTEYFHTDSHIDLEKLTDRKLPLFVVDL